MSTFTVERSAVIPAPVAAIYPLVESFREWTKWSPWETVDPTMQRSYDGPVTGVGAKYAWKGNGRAGAGTMELTGAAPTEITIRLAFTRPMRSVNQITFTFVPVGAGTRVTWTMSGESKGINKLFMLFMNMDKMVGRDFDKGLARLAQAVSGRA
ncbi:transcriptional regulator [Bacillus sp. SRB_336]|nr:transcriptional regulator [Bacillus sp. SRB_336]